MILDEHDSVSKDEDVMEIDVRYRCQSDRNLRNDSFINYFILIN
jgi:hypothetical protein